MEPTNQQTELAKRLGDYSLLHALTDRRSQRFGLGMSMDVGPLAFTSRQEPLPLTEEEEATLAFAACGITGYALADLIYDQEQPGGTWSPRQPSIWTGWGLGWRNGPWPRPGFLVSPS